MPGWGLLANVITCKMLPGPSRRGEVLESHYLHWAGKPLGNLNASRAPRYPALGQEDAGLRI